MMPTREEIIAMTAARMYGGKILNNAHRGDVVEMMVLAALGDQWRHVGLGWHPWDLQRGFGQDRVRIQVRQTAAAQVWADSKSRILTFGWKSSPPSYFKRDNPSEDIEDEGWFCHLFVFGIHDSIDRSSLDQVDPGQWEFLVIPICDLPSKLQSMNLERAKLRWKPVKWDQLRDTVASLAPSSS